MAIKSKELNELKKIIVDRIRKLKIRVVEVESQVEDMDTLIKKAVRVFIKNKVRKMVVRETTKQLEFVYNNLEGKLIQGYFDWINKLVKDRIDRQVEQGIAYKVKIVDEFNCNSKEIKEFYDKGWKLIFFGKLTDSGKQKFIFHKARKIKKKKK